MTLSQPRAQAIALLDLVSITASDGTHRFIVGSDGYFTDTLGDVWTGCQLLSASELRTCIQGEAAGGTLSLTYIPDPDDGDLIAQIRALGSDYVRGCPIRFYVQELLSMEEFSAPSLPPRLWMTRRGAHIEYDLSGALERRITLAFEGPFTGRNTGPGLQYTVADHGRMVGAANNSLRFMPTDTFQEQKLFG